MIKTISNVTIQEEIKNYYHEFGRVQISDKVTEKLREIADKIATQIIDSYDFKQYIKESDGGNTLVITSVFKKKDSNV